MKNNIVSLVLLSAGMCWADLPKRGAPVFSDGFDVVGTFAENWKVIGRASSRAGCLVQDAKKAVVCATPRRTIPLACMVEGSVAYRPGYKSKGWAGFSLDGYLFLLTPGGTSWLNLTRTKVTAGDNGKMVPMGGYKPGDRVKLTVVRIVTGGSLTYSFYANGLPAGSFTAPKPKPVGEVGGAPAYEAPTFMTYDAETTLDDFGVFALRDDAASPNLIANSSAEYDREGMPCALCRCGQYDHVNGPLEGYETIFLPGFGVDRTVAHSGKQSMFLKAGPLIRNPGFQCHNAGTLKGAAGVFSVWMKASVPGVTVSLAYAGKSRQHAITTEWARYEVTNPSLKGKGTYSPVTGGIVMSKSPTNTDFTVWFDDFQAEIVDLPEGGFKSDRTYASAYRPADTDKTRYGAKEKIVRPRLNVPELPASVKPTADLDTWREYACEAGSFMCGPRPAKLETKLYLACDRANLYIGCRAFGEPAANLAAAPLLSGRKAANATTAADKRDVLALYTRDSIELFLSPTQEKTWYQLMACANGQQTDLYREGIDWNGRWTLQTKASAGAVDYLITIPAADFATSGMKDVWLANFCRNDVANRESSCIFPVLAGEVKFRDMRRWAEVAFPHAVVEAWRTAPGVRMADVSKANAAKILGRLDFYMNEPEARFRITQDGQTEERTLDIRNLPYGTNEVTVAGLKTTVIKRPYREDAVQINRFARCLERHGRKILPLAHATPCLQWYWIDPPYIAALTEMYGKLGGFKYMSMNADASNFKHLYEMADAYLAVCAKYGIAQISAAHYLDTGTPGLDPATIAARAATNAVVRARLESQNVIASIVVDEPELWQKSEECYRYLVAQRPNFLYRPMMMNNTYMGIPNDYAHLETDILMIDDYLTNDEARTVDSALANVDIAIAKGLETGKPAWAYLVSQNYPLHSREPTYGEQIAQCYGALADGVSGIVFWGLMAPQTAGNWRAIKQLVREFPVLEGRILTEEPPAAVSCSAERAKMRYLPAVKEGTLTLVTCNIDESPLGKVTFSLPAPFAAATEAEVLFENRTVKIVNGALADDFVGHARHVYSVRTASGVTAHGGHSRHNEM